MFYIVEICIFFGTGKKRFQTQQTIKPDDEFRTFETYIENIATHESKCGQCQQYRVKDIRMIASAKNRHARGCFIREGKKK